MSRTICRKHENSRAKANTTTKQMNPPTEISLTLQNKELKRENLKLQRKIAKLEVKVISAQNKAKLAKPAFSVKLMREALDKVIGNSFSG
jgi:hypothetical protein